MELGMEPKPPILGQPLSQISNSIINRKVLR